MNQSVIVIIFGLAQSDPIKRRTLYCNTRCNNNNYNYEMFYLSNLKSVLAKLSTVEIGNINKEIGKEVLDGLKKP